MIYCRTCRTVWPTGTVYCGKCQGSLGVRICPSGHSNPRFVTACLTCGKPELSKYAPCLRIGCLSQVLAWLVALTLIRFGIAHVGSLLLLVWGMFEHLFAFLFQAQFRDVVRNAMGFFVEAAVILGFLHLALGERARPLFTLYRFVDRSVRLCLRWFVVAVKALVRRV